MARTRTDSAVAFVEVGRAPSARSAGSGSSNDSRSPVRGLVEAERARRGGTAGRAGSPRARRRRCRRRRSGCPIALEVHADLMRAAGLEPAVERACTPDRVNATRTSYSVRAALPDSRTAMRVRRAVGPPDRRVDHAARRRERAPHERDVPAVDACGSRSARRGCRTRAAVRATTSRPLVSRSRRCTMPGRISSPTRRHLGVQREQAVHERAVGVAGAGVHDEPGRLGEHHDVVVGVAHVDGTIAGSADGRRADRGLVEDLDHRARDEAVALPHRPAVDHDRVAREQRLHVGAAPTGEQRDRAVDRARRRASSGTAIGSSVTTRARRRRGGGAQRAHDQQDRADRDARVGDVEHRPPTHRDEVDDVAAQEARRAEDAVA